MVRRVSEEGEAILMKYDEFSRDHISILALHGEPLFFQHFDGPYYPTLKILHRCEYFSFSTVEISQLTK